MAGRGAAVQHREAMITDAAAVLAPVIEHLESASVKVHVADPEARPAEVLDIAVDIPVLVTGFMRFGAEEFRRLDKTRLIVRAGIGYDSIDIPAATRSGIWVANVPDFCTEEVADHTILLLLAAMRQLPAAMSRWRDRRLWTVNASLPSMHRIKGNQLGLVGMGRIGRLVADRAHAFGWNIAAYDPNLSDADLKATGVRPMPLHDLVGTSDALSLHLPLSEESHHLIDSELLTKARPGLILINTSRGGLVDLDALDDAIATGTVGFAGLDVLDGEPEPDLDHPLLSRSNVLVTSHTAWCSVDALSELSQKTAAQAIQYLDGHRPSNVLNPEARKTP